MLTADADAPPVAETAVGADLLEPLDVVAELGVEVLGEDLGVLAGLPVLLSVEEPEGDLELAGVLDDGLLTSISAFLQMRSAKRRPRPLILVRAKTTFRLPSTLVLRIRRMCWNSWLCINDLMGGVEEN